MSADVADPDRSLPPGSGNWKVHRKLGTGRRHFCWQRRRIKIATPRRQSIDLLVQPAEHASNKVSLGRSRPSSKLPSVLGGFRYYQQTSTTTDWDLKERQHSFNKATTHGLSSGVGECLSKISNRADSGKSNAVWKNKNQASQAMVNGNIMKFCELN